MPTSSITLDRVSYRNILMTGVVTERFNQRLIFHEGESDPRFTEFHIQVSSYLHLDDEQVVAIHSYGASPPPTDGSASTVYSDPASKLRAIEAYLSQPRGLFEYWSGGILMLRVGSRAAYGGNTDNVGTSPAGMVMEMSNGPQPRDVEVTETAAGNIYKVRFGIEFRIQICNPGETDPALPPDSQIQGNPPQSDTKALVHSWSYVESKDQSFWSTKTLSGSIRVRNELDWANSLRWLVVPPLQETYQRQAQRFVQSADKLTLEYSVNDKQRYAAPPEPATDWDCRYVQNFSGPVAVWKIETVIIRLTGAPGTVKRNLVKTAFEIVRSIIPSSMDPTKRPKWKTETDLETLKSWPTSFLHYAQIVDHVSESSIEMVVSFRTILPSKNTPHGGAETDKTTVQNLYIDNVGIFPTINKNDSGGGTHNRFNWPQPQLFDSNEPRGIFATYLQSACGSRHGITQGYQLTFRDGEGNITSGPPTTVHGNPYPLGQPEEVWGNSQPVQPEDYDDRAALDLARQQSDVFANETLTGEMRFPITEVELESEYQEGNNQIVLPKANSATTPPTIEIFSFGAPVLYRISRAILSRTGAWPVMPKPEKTLTTGDATETLVDYKIVYEDPHVESDGRTIIYRAQARLVYAVDRPILSMARLRTGITPMTPWSELTDAGQPQPSPVPEWDRPYLHDPTKLTNDLFGGNLAPPPP